MSDQATPGPEAGHAVSDADHVYIFDTTLRDGEQCPGATMTFEEKLQVADFLDEMGVDIIEAGFPIASDGDFEAVVEIARRVKRATVCGLARAGAKDIDRCGEAVRLAVRPRIHTFISTSPIHMKFKLQKEPAEVLEMVRAQVERARQFTDDVEWSAEDATRTEHDFLCRCVETAIKAGATTINIPDTVGYTVPEEYYALFKMLRERVPGTEKAIFSTHCHDDLGMAVANSLAGIRAGARQIECTINGIGERAGNAPLHTTVMILKELYGVTIPGFRYDMLWDLKRKVEEMSGLPVGGGEPIIGHNVFTHETGIHTAGITIHPAIYQVVQPEMVGGQLRFLFGKRSGAVAVEAVLKRNEAKLLRGGVDITPKLVQTLLKLIKDIRERKAENADHAEEIRQYYSNLNNLGLTEDDLVSYALVLGPELK